MGGLGAWYERVVSDERTAGQVQRRNLADEASRSLFVLPALIVLASAVLGEVLAEIDDRLDPGDLPGFLETTQDSARAILGAIAGGTITAAAVVLSFTLVAVQLASSQYSPRTLGRFLGDRFQQVVMGIVFGTFTYCIVVLREIEDVGPRAELAGPQLATSGAVVFSVAALLAVLASIDHTARSLQVESIAERVSRVAITIARDEYPLLAGPADPPDPLPEIPVDALEVPAHSTGWVQQFPLRAAIGCLPPGTTAIRHVVAGGHVAEGDPLATVWPVPPRPAEVIRALQATCDLGSTRTMQDDVGFGITQMVDIAARALSPAVNDPYTAQEIILRQTPLLAELVTRDLTLHPVTDGDRTVHPAPGWDTDAFLDLAVGSLRWHAREQPWVLITLIEQLRDLRAVAVDPAPVERQAADLLGELHRLAPVDVERVRAAARAAGWEA